MSKYFTIATSLLVASILHAQAIDEDYLNSLPPEIRNDVLTQIESRKDFEKPLYRSASSMIDKENFNTTNKVFGSKIFDQMQSSFMPINEPNIGSDYILDFGDILEIQIIGPNDDTREYKINRDGSINLADIGKVYLSGLSLNDASSLIKTEINKAFIGASAYISLISIRDIQILITGNAYNPGIYTLNGSSNILHALTMAGGIDENGSYRDIKLIRGNEVIDTIDLYKIFINGHTDYGLRLLSGDSILIAPRKKVVHVMSGVNRPGYYELKSNETFDELIGFANNISSNSTDQTIVQSADTNGININYFNLEQLKLKIPNNNDLLIIEEKVYGEVSISGAVQYPGTYKITDGDTLSKLIKRAGGYKEYAYPFGGFLNNKKTMEVNKAAKEKLYQTFITNFVINSNKSANDVSNSMLPFLAAEIKNSELSGRIIAEFDLDQIARKPDVDTILENGDQISIPLLTQQVYVYGDVASQGSVRYMSNGTIKNYLDLAGQVLKSADLNDIFIVHPNGETYKFNKNQSSLSFLKAKSDSQLIYPGSIIYVPKRMDYASGIAAAQVWAPIVSGLAISLASLNSIK